MFATSCAGPQSALAPAGRDAHAIAVLLAWMAGGSLLIWLGVMGAAVYATRAERTRERATAKRFIVLGGVVLPTGTLTVLLIFGLSMMPDLLAAGPAGAPRVAVSAERYWWRLTYDTPHGPVETANELRLPVGQRTTLRLTSPDVVHSFWVPSLAGKVDTIPGRETHLAIEPTRLGTFRGTCAEYCGGAHAQMAFTVVVQRPEEHAAWIAAQARAAEPPQVAVARRGAEVFASHGCGACHTVRGTGADGTVGPDLTHVGGRRRVAGILPNDVDGFARFVRDPEAVKPEAEMPGFALLSDDELTALAHYLDALE